MSCSVVQSILTVCDPMDRSMPGFPVLHQLPEFAQTHVHWVSDAIQPTHPLLPLLLLPLTFPSSRIFSSELALHIRGLKYWSFSLIFSSEYSELISFRIDWSDLPRDTQESSQHHSLKVSILCHSAFFYCPSLTSVLDYWKIHSFDYMDISWQSNISAF